MGSQFDPGRGHNNWGYGHDGGVAADCKSVTSIHRGFESLYPHKRSKRAGKCLIGSASDSR